MAATGFEKAVLTATLTALAIGLATIPAEADWLVTKGTTRIETRGTWEVKGPQVIFTRTDGRLVTLPVALFDLEASRAATAASMEPPAPTATPEPPTSVAVITDADVAHVHPATAEGMAARGSVTSGPRVTLYSASWCGWCRKTKALLAELGVSFTEKDVDRDPVARRELLQRTGGRFGVPVLDIDGTVVRGYVPERIRGVLGRPTSQPPDESTSE